MTRRKWTTLARARIFEASGGICHICGCAIDGTRDPWDLEHVIPLAMDGEDTEANLRPAHRRCHAVKTTEDRAKISKCNRVRAKNQGARKPSRFQGSRNSRWKKKISGEVVPR